jgi:hypothetical protein
MHPNEHARLIQAAARGESAPDAPVIPEVVAHGDVEASADAPAAPFDPSEHNVAEVMAYLADATDEEYDRVLAAETDGKARSSIIG